MRIAGVEAELDDATRHGFEIRRLSAIPVRDLDRSRCEVLAVALWRQWPVNEIGRLLAESRQNMREFTAGRKYSKGLAGLRAVLDSR